MGRNKMLYKNKKATKEGEARLKARNTAEIFIVVFAIFSVLLTVFILSNSLLDFEASHKSSGAIVDIIIPDDAKDVLIDDKTPEYYLRKCVHFLV